MPFKPFSNHSEIQTMDAEVLWENLSRAPEDLSLEEINTFFLNYINNRFLWLDRN